MEPKQPYRCIGLVARQHGFASISNLVEKFQNFKITAIFTHKFNPKSYDPEQRIRSDFNKFQKFAEEYDIPFFTVDSKDENEKLNSFVKKNEFDFLISISWRYLIPKPVFQKARIGTFNIHRGDLPKYAGVEPIKRAIENNEDKTYVCSHIVDENFDEGKVICKASHPINYNSNKSKEENIERLKYEITPFFLN